MTSHGGARQGEVRYTLWAKHDRVRYWIAIECGMRLQPATDEMVIRQDRVRRSGQPCKFRLLPDGKRPDE